MNGRSARQRVIIDVDDVILHHTRHLHDFLWKKNIEIRRSKEHLDHELFDKDSQTVLDQGASDRLFEEAFKEIANTQTEVDGASAAVSSISEFCDILFLSNVPSSIVDVRKSRLARLGLDFPLARNSGGKGKAVRALQEESDHPIIFIDDSERQIRNVRKHSPHTLTVKARFIEYQRSDDYEDSEADHSFSSWADVHSFIKAYCGI